MGRMWIHKVVWLMAIAVWSTQAYEIYPAAAPVLHPQCPQIDDISYPKLLPHPQDCSKYYSCSSGYAYTQICPENFHFSATTHRCDYPHIAMCQQQSVVPVTIPISAPPVMSLPPPPTPTLGPPIYQSHPSDCNHYYQCQPMRCPATYHWSSQTQQCDIPQVAQCPYQQPPQVPPVLPPPIVSHPPILPPVPSVPSVPSVTIPNYSGSAEECAECASWCLGQGHIYLPYPQDCRKFVQCNGLAFIHKCPDQLLWNDKLKTCDRFCVRSDDI